MGYGHLRAAWPLAERLGTSVQRADLPPLASAAERRIWSAARETYERLSRLSQHSLIGRPFDLLFKRLTAIRALAPRGGGRRPDWAARFLGRCIERGLASGLCEHLESTGMPLLTTFYAPAIAVDRMASTPVFCVVTDNDIHRVWAPLDGHRSRIRYLVPTAVTAKRLLAYGVRKPNIEITGFPLPPALEERAEEVFEGRLRRLEGRAGDPPLLTVAIGGAGAQAGRVRRLLRSLAGPLRTGDLRVALVAGLRRHLAQRFRRWTAAELGDAMEGVEVVDAHDFAELYRRFNTLLERTDALWTKPSELSFYAALGLPLILDDPVGDHERANARWLLDGGAARLRPLGAAVETEVPAWLSDGTLAGCAHSAFECLPRGGTAKITDVVLSNS
jgi:UDP-N-acetylglucosamine:LPS N-acetylglucosamine transferase